MNNLLSYCGLVDTRISDSEKDLPVCTMRNQNTSELSYHFEFSKSPKINKRSH